MNVILVQVIFLNLLPTVAAMQRELINLPPETRPILTVVIHTEEEFDWNKPHDRNATGVKHMQYIDRAQSLFDEYEIIPNYVIDYPIASQESAVAPLKSFADSGRALIGAHLHPWVSPPHVEDVNAYNSYPGNLPRELEAEKLRLLTDTIYNSLGTRPVTYLAGRYGFGPNTGDILEELNYEVDISPAVPINFSADGGPDYSDYTNDPYWFGNHRKLLGLPGTGGYTGAWHKGGSALYQRLTHPLLRRMKLSSLVARLRLMERIRLSPEDYSEAEMRRMTDTLINSGVRIFVFSFHSPSIHPGGTPYVQSKADLQQFIDKCHRYFSYFLGTLGGTSMTPVEIRNFLSSGARNP